MVLFSGQLPEIIRFGRGCRHQLRSLLPPGNTLVVCGRHSLERVRRELGMIRQCTFAVVSGELPLHELEAIVGSARRDSCRNFIGWGGGSAMDCAKAAAALTDAPLAVEDYFYNRAELPERENFLALLPTTAGTGAEITANAVIRDDATRIKQSLRGPGMTADAALIDPELLDNAPMAVTASAGFDALTQALESFTSIKTTPLCSSIAAAAAKLILNALERGCANDPAALDELARGSMMTGIAFASSGLGAVHGLAHPLGSVLDIPHGECCGTLLLPVLKRNAEYKPELFETLACDLGFSSKEALFAEIARLQSKLGIPEKFSAPELLADNMDFVIKNCRSGSMKCNQRQFSDDELRRLLEELI